MDNPTLDAQNHLFVFLSIKEIRIYPNYFPARSGIFGMILPLDKQKKLYSRYFFDNPDVSGLFSIYIWITILGIGVQNYLGDQWLSSPSGFGSHIFQQPHH